MADIRKCGGCGRQFESHGDNNFCNACIAQDREDAQLLSCPMCSETYDDADADFLICSHCGYDAEEKRFTPVRKNLSRLGIDPDVKLDDWS